MTFGKKTKKCYACEFVCWRKKETERRSRERRRCQPVWTFPLCFFRASLLLNLLPQLSALQMNLASPLQASLCCSKLSTKDVEEEEERALSDCASEDINGMWPCVHCTMYSLYFLLCYLDSEMNVLWQREHWCTLESPEGSSDSEQCKTLGRSWNKNKIRHQIINETSQVDG